MRTNRLTHAKRATSLGALSMSLLGAAMYLVLFAGDLGLAVRPCGGREVHLTRSAQNAAVTYSVVAARASR